MNGIQDMSTLSVNRSSNIELFRIVLMFFIVAHHYVVNSGMMSFVVDSQLSWCDLFLALYGAWGKVGINCFVLITGYFMCKSQISVHKFLKLVFEVLFYNIVLYASFAITHYHPFAWKEFLRIFMPIGSIADGFVSCFLVYYLLIPFLNTLVQNLSHKQHLILISICMFFFVVCDHLPNFKYIYNYVGWFCVLHIIAAYIRFYEDKISKLLKGKDNVVVAIAFMGAVCSILFQLLGAQYGFAHGWPYKWVIDCNAIFAVIASVSLFWYFKHLNVPQSKIINAIASATFGIYLLHSSGASMRQWLWQDMFRNVEWYSSQYLLIHAFGSVIIIFVIGIILDRIRVYVFEKPTFKIIDRYLLKYGIS